ncbi:MAG: hypothetical protein EBS01_02030, partial [Verrucomicrobia bacterium]|nr:hypothetical protein [Verrucomicrobiota bacterium]
MTTGGTLSLTSNMPITVTSQDAAFIPTVSGTLSLAGGANTLTIGPIQIGGVTYTKNANSLNIAAAVHGGTASIIKTGDGLLQLGGSSTFSGGVTVYSGGLVLGSSSTPASQFGAGLGLAAFTGPLGTGTLTVADGATLLGVDNATSSLANPVVFLGGLKFDKLTGVNQSTLNLNGAVTPTLSDFGAFSIDVANPSLSVNLVGALTNAALVTSITKTGFGNFGVNLNGTNAPSISVTGGSTLALFSDEDGTSRPNTISLGAVTFNTSGLVPALTLGNSGQTQNYNQAANKTVAPASFSSPNLPLGLTLTANNGFGLLLNDDINFGTLSAAQGPTFTVNNATASNLVPGLTLAGVLSGASVVSGGTALTKAGLGTLVLGGNSNAFGSSDSLIDVKAGILQFGSEGALGNVGTLRISTNSATQGIRVDGGSVA